MVPLSRAIYEGACVTTKTKGRVSYNRGTSNEIPVIIQDSTGLDFESFMKGKWPILNELVRHPMRPLSYTEDLYIVIGSLNDGSCEWSREKIAEWVAKIEKERGYT